MSEPNKDYSASVLARLLNHSRQYKEAAYSVESGYRLGIQEITKAWDEVKPKSILQSCHQDHKPVYILIFYKQRVVS
jgi:uncharacterized protein YfbU (UPF0304 family)